MTIQGQSKTGTIIDAQQLGNIFNIPESSSIVVTIANLTMINGSASSWGGAIANSDPQSTLNVINCTLTNNEALNLASYPYGGAIYSAGALNVIDSDFSNNRATTGGAIYIKDLSNKPVTIIRSTFTSNTAVSTQGGAICQNYGYLTISNSSFTGNTAYDGGSIYQYYVQSETISNCTFINNRATGYAGEGGQGGAICNEAGTYSVSSIYGCLFTNNHALTIGGAIYNMVYSNMTVTGSKFTGNTAGNTGGAISDDSGKISILNTIFTNNSANTGGALYSTGGNVHYNSIFNNTASLGSGIYSNEYSELITSAENNWWGSNANPRSNIAGLVNYNPWIVLKITGNATNVTGGSTATFTADLTRNSNDDPSGGYVPDGTDVLFATDIYGSVNPLTGKTVNGIATTTYLANFISGTSIVNATVNNQTMSTSIIVISPFKPELVPSNLTVPSDPYTLSDYPVSVLVSNIGNADSPGFNVALKDNGTTVETQRINSLAIGANKLLTFTWTPTYPGSHLLLIIVDYNGEVVEYNETNNTINATTYVYTPTQLVVDPVSGYKTDNVNLVATLLDASYNTPIDGKSINFTVNGSSVGSATTNSSGVATLSYNIILNPRIYTIFAEFIKDSLYLGSNNTNNLTVNYTPTNVTVNASTGYYTDTINLTATLTDTIHNTPISGKTVYFKIDNAPVDSATTNSDGIATLSYIIPLNAGTHTIFAYFNQDTVYTASNGTNNLTVPFTLTQLTITPATGYYNDTINLMANLTDTIHNTPISGKTIQFTVNGSSAGSAITNGSGTATLPYKIPLTPGNYTIFAQFQQDLIYTGSNEFNKLTVNYTPTNITVNATTGYNTDTVNLIATLTDTAHSTPISGKTLNFKVNGISAGSATTNASGIATLSYNISLNAGNYIIFVEFPQDIIYNASNGTNNLTVPHTPTNLTVNSTTGYNTDTVNLIATLKDTAHNTPISGKTVHFTVNGTDAGSAITNAYGIATQPYTIPLNPGTYTIFAQFQQDLIYDTSNGTNNLTVNKTPTNITVNAVTGYNSDTVNLVATLKDTAHNTPLSGKAVYITVNGTDAGSAITNSSGIATLSYIINLNANIYTILAEFKGDTIYNASNGTNNLTVPHTPTNITVNALTGYNSDTVNLIATLKDTIHSTPISGKTLNFKVNGISAGSAITNASGIATLSYNIGLNAGNYIIFVEFPQDIIYNASNGTNNLTIPHTHQPASP